MPEIPSIKGVAFLTTWSEAANLIDQEMVSREELVLRLDPDTLDIIGEKIEAGLWYPIKSVEQLANLVLEFAAGGDMQYLVEMGERGFERLLQRDSFHTFIETARRRGDRAGQTLIGLTDLLFNFGEWSFVGDSLDGFRIELREAEALGETLCWVCVGYIAALVSHVTTHPTQVTLDRTNPTCITFEGRRAT